MSGMRDYAKALFELTEEDGNSAAVLASAETIASLLDKNPDYIRLLDSPAVPKSERTALVDRAFSGAEPMLMNLIDILVEKRLMHAFGEAVSCLRALYEEANGIVTATAVTTVPLSKDQKERLAAKIGKITGKTVNVKNEIDPALIGGITLRFEGRQFDGSIRARLDDFARSLGQIIV